MWGFPLGSLPFILHTSCIWPGLFLVFSLTTSSSISPLIRKHTESQFTSSYTAAVWTVALHWSRRCFLSTWAWEKKLSISDLKPVRQSMKYHFLQSRFYGFGSVHLFVRGHFAWPGIWKHTETVGLFWLQTYVTLELQTRDYDWCGWVLSR